MRPILILILLAIMFGYILLSQRYPICTKEYYNSKINKTIEGTHNARFICSSNRLKIPCNYDTLFCQRYLLKIKIELIDSESINIYLNYTTNDHFSVFFDDYEQTTYELFLDPLFFDHSSIYCNNYYNHFSNNPTSIDCDTFKHIIDDYKVYHFDSCSIVK